MHMELLFEKHCKVVIKTKYFIMCITGKYKKLIVIVY